MRKGDKVYELPNGVPIQKLTPNGDEGHVVRFLNGQWRSDYPFTFGTSSSFATDNLIYPENLLLIETDTGRAKLTNGVDAYLDLDYIFNVTGSGLNGIVDNYSSLPDPTTVANQFWAARNSQGTAWLPGGLGGTYYSSGIYYSDGVEWTYLGSMPYQASQAEVDAGIVSDKFVTPKTLNDWVLNLDQLPLYKTIDEAINVGGLNDGDWFIIDKNSPLGTPGTPIKIIL